MVAQRIASLETGERTTIADKVPHQPTDEEIREQEEREYFVSRVYAVMALAMTITVANGMLTVVFVASSVEYH